MLGWSNFSSCFRREISLRRAVADVKQSDNVGVVELFELLQEGDLSEDGHGDAVLRQREAHLLQRHDRVRRLVARPVHRP